ncbi:MAG: EthD family reductase [Ardenticatenaceae bacterium]|nr:EthD family reductase [Ardenticatenaceae bacterium]HBY99190.1 EthD family reductase [Chloroflexota bacterium]
MHKLVALYRQPENTTAFDEHYFNTHAPLMANVPGYERIEVSRVTRTLMGQPEYYLMYEMWFADKDALRAALRSPQNAAAGQDLAGFAGELVTIFTAETVE